MVQTGIVLFAAILVVGFFFARYKNAPADAAIAVQRIDGAALDELMNAGDNRLVVSFMAAWCGPCIDELPTLNKLFKKYEKQGLQLIGISIDLEGPQAIQPAIQKNKVTFPVFWYGDAAIEKYKINGIPMLFFVKNGEVVERVMGMRPPEFLDNKIGEFLADE